MTESMLHLIGETFDERFLIEKFIGKGGMGAVFLARHLLMDKPVALKVLSRGLSDEATQVTRFNQEAQSSSRLRHPNTIRVFDFGRAEQGHLYIAMEYLEGEELSKVIKREAPLPPGRIVHILTQIGKSIAEAHNIGIIHRDVKPDNIFLSDVYGERDFVKVLDFGIAKIVNDEELANLTQTGFICGTPTYLAPEVAMGTSITPATDIYSIGVLAYQMLVGRPPFRADTPMAVVMKHIHDPVPPIPAELGVPAGLESLVLEMLSKDPTQRPQDADVLLERLAEALSERVLKPKPPPLPQDPQAAPTEEVNEVGRQSAPTIQSEAASGEMTPEQRNAQTSALPTPTGVSAARRHTPGRGWNLAFWGGMAALGFTGAFLLWPQDGVKVVPTSAIMPATPTAKVGAGASSPSPAPASLSAPAAAVMRPIEPKATMTLKTVPPGAEAFEDGVSLGVTPLTLSVVPPGSAARALTLRLDGYVARTLSLEAGSGSMEVALEARPSAPADSKARPDESASSSAGRAGEGRDAQAPKGSTKAVKKASQKRPKKRSKKRSKSKDRWRDFEAR